MTHSAFTFYSLAFTILPIFAVSLIAWLGFLLNRMAHRKD